MQGRGSKLSITHQSHQRTSTTPKRFSSNNLSTMPPSMCVYRRLYFDWTIEKKFVSLSHEQMLTEIIFTSRNKNIFAQFRFPSFDYNVLQIKKKL